ncbi:unnamed protein product [Bathycoccus prasinos]
MVHGSGQTINRPLERVCILHWLTSLCGIGVIARDIHVQFQLLDLDIDFNARCGENGDGFARRTELVLNGTYRSNIQRYVWTRDREDLGKLVINPPNMTVNVEKAMNYISWFDSATSNLILNYITKHRLKNGEHLFGTFGKDGKISATIAAWLVEAGMKDCKVQGQTKTPGAINLLRHAYISQKIKEEDVMK